MKRLLLLLVLAVPGCERRTSSSWDTVKETVAPVEDLEGSSFTFTTSGSWSTTMTMTVTDSGINHPQRVDVMDFEGTGLRTIGVISSAGVFTLDSSLRCKASGKAGRK